MCNFGKQLLQKYYFCNQLVGRSTFITGLILLCLSQLLTGQDLTTYLQNISQYNQSGNPHSALQEMLKAETYAYETFQQQQELSNAIVQINLQKIDMESLELIDNISDLELGRAYEFNGTRLFLTGNIDEAEKNYEKALKILKPLNKVYDVYKWQGLLYGSTQQSDKAIETYYRTIEAAESEFQDEPDRVAKLTIMNLANMQTLLVQKGDYKSAKNNSRISLQYAQQLEEDFYLATAYLGEATLHVAKNDPENAIETINKAADHFKDHQTLKINSHNILAVAYTHQEDHDNAIKNYELAYQGMAASPLGIQSALVNKVAIQEIQFKEKKYSLALEGLNEVIPLYESNPGQSTSSLADAYMVRSKVQLALGNIELAYEDINKALALPIDYRNWKIKHLASLTNIYTALFKKTGQPEYKDSILWSINQTDAFIDTIKNETRHLESETGINQLIFEAYPSSLDGLYLLDLENKEAVDPSRIFRYFEALKSYSLKEYLKTDQAVVSGMIPDSILETERKIKNKLGGLKKELLLKENINTGDRSQDPLNSGIDSLEKVYASFIKRIEDQYPKYHEFKYAEYKATFEEAQKALSHDEAYVEYYVTYSTIYTLCILKDDYKFLRIPKSENWKTQFNSFLEILKNPEHETNSEIAETSYEIYNTILKPLIDQLPEEIKFLKIIRDNELNFLPFEVLVMEPDLQIKNLNELPFLIKSFTLSYDSSVRDHLASNKKRTNSSHSNYIGFTANYSEPIIDLPYTRKNIEELTMLFHQKKTEHPAISPDNILELSQGNKIIHYGMHGVIDQRHSSLSHLIVSSEDDGKLYVSDIYASDISGNLVFLGACNTGVGKFMDGDGMQNLSRAFRFAGIPSTVMSLWSIPDIQTTKIEYKFFQHLRNGVRVDEALRQAKLDYLNSAPSAYQHPYYWAGLIPLGKMDDILSGSPIFYGYRFVALVLISLILLFFFLKKK